MELSGQPHALAILLSLPPCPGERTLVPIEYEAEWAPELVRQLLERDKCHAGAVIQTLDSPACSMFTVLTMLAQLPFFIRFIINDLILGNCPT